jgi:Domain of unknown function (DUF4157)
MELKYENNNRYYDSRAITSQKYDVQNNDQDHEFRKQNDNILYRNVSPNSGCPCDGTCPKCRSERNTAYIPYIQPKLKVSNREDPLEKEADMFAEQIMNMSNPSHIGRPLSINRDSKSIASRSECSPCDIKNEGLKGDENELKISRKGSLDEKNDYVSNELSNDLDTIQSGGIPLDILTKELMESRFGHDFSNVRIHNDENASRSATTINALAYTAGNDIIFSSGHYDPNTNDGKRLIAHELVHVIQQSDQNDIAAHSSNQDSVNVTENGNDIIPSLSSSPFQLSRQEKPSDIPLASINPEIATLSWGKYADRFSHIIYDLDYRSEGGNLSRWLRVVYPDGTEIDINIFSDFTEISLNSLGVRNALAQAHIGVGGRIFPATLNEQTVPNLWAARKAAIEAMEEQNFRFILAAMPAITFIITMPMTTMGLGSKAIRRPTAIRLSRLSAGAASRFTAVENAIINESKGILSSAEMAELRAANIAGKVVKVNIGGRIIQYEPGLSASGMTMFGENGFILGREAFASEAELTKTVLHELYRLSTSVVKTEGASAAAVASETTAAFQFAERAYRAFFL